MKIIHGFLSFFVIVIAFFGIAGSPGCANIIPPTGGPKDTLPPVLLSSAPGDSMLHFTGKNILFTFDEYVQLKDKEKNLIINPSPKQVPIIDNKLKTVFIKIRDTLEENTTYSIDFGRSLGDFNEFNVLKNFTYVFSTGSYLDSMTFSGRVIIAKTGKVDSSMIVMLHRSMDDSAVSNGRPRYVTRLDTLGNFTFHYLKPGTYRVYALKDEAGSRTYASKSQLFAFADSPIDIRQHTAPVLLYAYADESQPKKSSKSATTGNGNQAAPPAAALKKPESDKNKRLQLQFNLSNGEFDVLDTLRLQFPIPLKAFDSTKFELTDELYKPITNYTLIIDSLKRKISIVYKWPTETKYHIIADKEFAEDTLGKKLAKIDTVSFQTKRESTYGSVSLTFKNLDMAKNPVLQFVQNDAVKYAFPLKSRTFFAKLFQPGEYELRILYDNNKNGVWDPGDFFINHRQPEKVQPIRTRNAKHIFNVRANWDNMEQFNL